MKKPRRQATFKPLADGIAGLTADELDAALLKSNADAVWAAKRQAKKCRGNSMLRAASAPISFITVGEDALVASTPISGDGKAAVVQRGADRLWWCGYVGIDGELRPLMAERHLECREAIEAVLDLRAQEAGNPNHWTVRQPHRREAARRVG